MANIFDQFDESNGAPAIAKGANIFDQFDTPQKPESGQDYVEGIAQSAGQGATLGFGDEIAAAFGSGFGLGPMIGSKTYDQILEETRARGKKFSEAHPYVSTGAEIAGGLSTLAAGPAKAVVQAPTWLARAANSAKIGAGFGAASGFGNSEDGAVNRVVGAGKGAAAGAVLGPAIADVAFPVVSRAVATVPQAIRFANRAVRAARDPEGAAYANVADKAVQSGLDFDQMLARVSPERSANLATRGFTEDDIASIVSRQLQGESAASVAQDLTAQGKQITAATVRDYFKRYQDSNPTPLGIIDVAKEVSGDAAAGPLTRYARAAHSIVGGEDSTAAQALVGRQELQPGRVSSIIEKRVGGGDLAAQKKAHAKALQEESTKAYKAFHDEPDLATDNLADLMEEPMFRNAMANAKRQERVDIIRENQEIAKRNAAAQKLGKPNKVEPLKPVPDVNEETQVFSPKALDLIQRDLRLTGEGFSNPNEANYARNLREVFLDRIEQFYPTFRNIRQTYASGKMEQDAFDAGRRLTTKLGAPTREALSEYESMSPAQQAIFRNAFGSALQDKAAGTVAGAQAANQFTSQSFRQIVEKLFPKSDKKLYEQGQKLIQELKTEATTTRTKNDVLAGSRTAELSADLDKVGTAAEAAANISTGNIMGVLRTLTKRLTQQIGSEGAKQSLKLLTETDPAKLIQTLQRLARESKGYARRQAYVAAIRELRSGAFARGVPVIGNVAGEQNAVGRD